MDIFKTFEQLRDQYPTMSAGSLVVFGIAIGLALAYLFYKQQIDTLKSRIDHLNDALSDKVAPHLAARALVTQQPITGRSRMGTGLIILGLLIAIVGVAVLLSSNKDRGVAGGPLPPSQAKPTTQVKKAALQKFYIDGAKLLRELPKDISQDEYKKYDAEANSWLNEAVNWIDQNMGDAAKARFLDVSRYPGMHYSKAVNDDHQKVIGGVVNFRSNLQVLISEFDAWNTKD